MTGLPLLKVILRVWLNGESKLPVGDLALVYLYGFSPVMNWQLVQSVPTPTLPNEWMNASLQCQVFRTISVFEAASPSVCSVFAFKMRWLPFFLTLRTLTLLQSRASVDDIPGSSRSWPPSGSTAWADTPVWTLVGLGWHSAVGGPWWNGSQSSACTGAASAGPRGHRTHCTLTMNWPPSWVTHWVKHWHMSIILLTWLEK